MSYFSLLLNFALESLKFCKLLSDKSKFHLDQV